MSVDSPAPPWLPLELQSYYVAVHRTVGSLSPEQVPSRVQELCDEQEVEVDHRSVTLYAGTNVTSPKARRLLASSVGTRPSMGYPGEKYQTGVQRIEQLEVLTVAQARRIFGARFAEVRLHSGTLANLAAFAALTEPGDAVLVLPERAGGHASHHAQGVAGLRGLRLSEIPFDPERMNIDLDGLRQAVRRHQPRLVVVGASLMLFPYPLPAVADTVREVGGRLLYDAAHVAGLVAAGRFQDPLAEGADLMTCSTYKSFGGPPNGLVVTNDHEVARSVDRVAYPGMTANYDASHLASLAVAQAEVLAFWPQYADACIANAQRLAVALADAGFRVVGAAAGYTASHHVALDAHDLDGGDAAARRLEPARILLSSIPLPWDPPAGSAGGLRIGVQEVTRWGFGPAEMDRIAGWMRRVLLGSEPPENVAIEVEALRRDFNKVCYCFPDGA